MLRNIAFNMGISFGARIAGVILGLFSLGLTTRLLGQEGFGLYSTALAWAYLFSFVADLGLYSLLVRDAARVKGEEEQKVVSNVFTLRLTSLLFFLGVGILIALVSPWTFGVSALAILLASLQYLFLSMSQVLMGVFQKYLRMEIPAAAEIGGRLLNVASLLLLFYLFGRGVDYHSVLFVVVFGAAFIALVNIIRARKLVSFALSFDIGYWKGLLIHTYPIALSIILTAVYFKLDTLFIAFFRGQGEVGLYNAAYRVLESLIFFPAMFVGLLMPQFSRLVIRNRERFRSLFQGAFDVLLIIAFPLTLGMAFESQSIMALIAGSEFVASSNVLGVLAFALFMIFFGALFSNGLIALNLQKKLAFIYFVGAIVNVVTNILVVPIWGYIGAGVTTLWTEALVTFFMIRLLEREVPLRLRFIRFFPIAFSGIVMAGVLYLTDIHIIISVLGSLVIYSVLLWITGGVSRKDLNHFIRH